MAVPWLIVKAVWRKIGAKFAEPAVLSMCLGLKETVSLSDVVSSCKKDTNSFRASIISDGFRCDCGCVPWQPIPDGFRSRGNIQEVERQSMPKIG